MMKSKWMFGLVVFASIFASVSAFAGGVATCEQAAAFLKDESFSCNTTGTDCSTGECVDTASCRYIKGVAGFSINFAYPTDCNFQ